MIWKIVWKMVWFYKFWGGINDWDLKILYRDLESWKKWNEMEWFGGLKKLLKIVWKIVWLCKFRGGINSWDLKILYRDLESWKKGLKKNEMVCRIRKLNSLE